MVARVELCVDDGAANMANSVDLDLDGFGHS
jgi:hypothetical protein